MLLIQQPTAGYMQSLVQLQEEVTDQLAIAQVCIVWYVTDRHGKVCYCLGQYGTVLYDTVQYSIVCYCTVINRPGVSGAVLQSPP